MIPTQLGKSVTQSLQFPTWQVPRAAKGSGARRRAGPHWTLSADGHPSLSPVCTPVSHACPGEAGPG